MLSCGLDGGMGMGKVLFSTEKKFPSISGTHHGPAPRPSPKITLPAAFLRIVVHMPGSFLYIFSEKAMAPHSSTLAWKIPGAEEPGRLQSMGS